MKRSILLTGTFFIISTVYIFTLFSWISLQTISHLMHRWGHQSEMTIYIRPEASASEINKIKDTLNAYSDKIQMNFQSQEDIRKSINKLIPRNETDFANNDELSSIIPPHFIITGNSNLFGNSLFNLFDSISLEIKKFPFVESASFGKSWMDKYTNTLASLKNGTIIFLFVLAMSVVLAIGNTIRSHINTRREEIEILELVGATPSMIRRPFLIEGAFLSISAMIFAFTFTALVTYLLKNYSVDSLQYLDLNTALHQFSIFESLVGVFLAGIVGFLGSFFCLTEINTGWAASEKGKNA